MSLRGKSPEGIRPGSLKEIVETGRTRKPTSCLSRGLGMQKWEESPAAARLDALFATVANENVTHGAGGRKAYRKAERLARAADRQTSAADLETSYAAALRAMSALNAPESEDI